MPRVARSRPGLLAALAVSALVASGLGAAQRDPPRLKLSIGVVRRDGILLPFAAYDDGRWTVPWPGPLAGLSLPVSLGDVPKKWWGPPGPDAPWKMWRLGQTSATITLTPERLIQFPAFCTTRLGVMTNYRRGPVNPRDPTVPTDGLAIAGDATLLPIETVSPVSATGRTLLAAITDTFNEQEELVSHRFTKWKHPIPKESRKQVAIQIEAIYRSSENTPRGAWTNTYFEAVRRFPPGPNDQGCGLITYANGWVRDRAGKPPSIALGAHVTYCDREGVAFMLPFGRLILKNEVYWVYQLSSWRDEAYFISDIRPDQLRPVVVVSGGECSH